MFVSDLNVLQLDADMGSEDSKVRSCQWEITSYQPSQLHYSSTGILALRQVNNSSCFAYFITREIFPTIESTFSNINTI